jgi:hypothetical protein
MCTTLDFISIRPLLGATAHARRFLEELIGRELQVNEMRIKHAFETPHGIYVNVRRDNITGRPSNIDDHGGRIIKIDKGGTIIPISHPDIGWSGAADPRYFWQDGSLRLIFSADCRDSHRRMFLYFEETGRCVRLDIPGFTFQRSEKNWTPLVVGTTVYLVYAFRPFILLRLDDADAGLCSVVANHATLPRPAPLYPFGGSPLVPWRAPYHIALVHRRRPWRPALLVFDEEQMGIAAIGTPFSVPEPPEAIKWRDRDVQYPYHLEIGSSESRMLIECQDCCPTEYVLRTDRVFELAERSLRSLGHTTQNRR